MNGKDQATLAALGTLKSRIDSLDGKPAVNLVELNTTALAKVLERIVSVVTDKDFVGKPLDLSGAIESIGLIAKAVSEKNVLADVEVIADAVAEHSDNVIKEIREGREQQKEVMAQLLAVSADHAKAMHAQAEASMAQSRAMQAQAEAMSELAEAIRNQPKVQVPAPQMHADPQVGVMAARLVEVLELMALRPSTLRGEIKHADGEVSIVTVK